MSDRHIHTTGFLYERDPAKIAEFIGVLEQRFTCVTPIRRDRDACPIAIAWYSSDMAYEDEISALPDAVEALTGIFEQDVTIVSAWDSDHETKDRTRLWRVPGWRTSPGKTITGRVEPSHPHLMRETL